MNRLALSRPRLRRLLPWVLVPLLASAAGCGQSGPLTLPDRTAAQQQNQDDDADRDSEDTSRDER
jgi:predicted small lipoprotein YifL